MTVPNTNDSETHAAASSPRRPWWKLHLSTKVVLAIAVLGLILANLPGQVVMHADVPDQGKYGPHYSPNQRYEHGWPVGYMTRSVWKSNCWKLNDRISHFSPLSLSLNLTVALLLLGASAGLFESWRRRRKSLFRFRLIELFGVMTVVAIAAGWYQYKIRLVADEQNALRDATADYRERFPDHRYTENWDVIYDPGGASFLRELLGDNSHLVNYCQVVSADCIDANPRFAGRFPWLMCIAPHNGLDEEEARAVASLQNLETLDLMMSELGSLSSYSPLRRLRGINLYESVVTERDLEWLGRCTNLEQIEMTGVNIGDEGLRKLRGLKKLKALSVGGGHEGPAFTDGCFELLSQLDSLEELNLDGEFRGETVEALLRLKRLKELRLSSRYISPATLKHLEKFGHLTWLRVDGGISKEDVARLQAAIPHCTVNDSW